MIPYRTHDGSEFTSDSLERALSSHRDAGLILGWIKGPGWITGGKRKSPLYIVECSDRQEQYLASIWEAQAFVRALASARTVMESRLGGS